MEDRSSRGGDGEAFEITLRGTVGRVEGSVRLTELATAVRASGNAPTLEWLVREVSALGLPSEEFRCTVGLKVKRGYRVSIATRLLPAALATEQELENERKALEAGTPALAKVGNVKVDVAAYELLVQWNVDPFTTDGTVPTVAIPVSWTADVLERHGQREAAFRTRVRWLMTELMLARYGLDSYKEAR